MPLIGYRASSIKLGSKERCPGRTQRTAFEEYMGHMCNSVGHNRDELRSTSQAHPKPNKTADRAVEPLSLSLDSSCGCDARFDRTWTA